MLYKKIDKNSINTISSALNVFELPPTHVAISGASYKEILTLNPINARPFHFKVFSSSSYIDLSKSYLMVELRIYKMVNGVETILEENESVATINLIGSTWIKNLRILVNNQEVENSNSLYAYKNYFDTVLSFPEHVKKSQLTAAGYYEDYLNHPANTTNPGYIKRKNLFAGSKTAQFLCKLNSDLFNQDLFLINNVELDIEIMPNDDRFLIMAPAGTGTAPMPDYRIEIKDCKLYVKTIELFDSLSIDINARLDKEPATYPIRKTMIKSFYISDDRRELQTNLFTDTIPRRVILALVEHDAYVGNKAKSPFNFKHFNVREITLSGNGRQYPNVLYDLDYPNDKYLRAYYDMLDAVGYSNSLDSNGISREMFKQGYAIYVYNMTNSLDNDQYFELIKSGTTMLHIKFNENVPAGGLTLIAYMEADGILMIDKNRALTSDNTL